VFASDKSKQINSRSIRNDDDFWLVRNLLIETHPITPPDFNWDIRRWDGSFFHNEEPGWSIKWGKDSVRLWETGDGHLVGAVHPESGRGDPFIQVHPDFRHLEEEMIIWAEENLAKPQKDSNQPRVIFFVYEYDILRQRILEKRGYEKLEDWGVIRHLYFGNKSIPHPQIANGYMLRTTSADDPAEPQKVADLFNAAFRRSIHTGKEVATFWANSPSYRRDLELVAEAPDGSLTALIGMIYEETNRFGLFEPVCTHPDHRGKGLASTLMFEGIHRVKALGAIDVYVATGDMEPANKLYESVGFTEVYKGYYWRKGF
jgi:mycothiol synthase